MVLSQHRLQCPRPFSAFVPSEKRNQAGGTIGGLIRLQLPSAVAAGGQLLPAGPLSSDACLRKILTFDEAKRNRLYLNFEVFNLADTWSARGYTSSQAYTETKSILTPAPSDLYVTAARRKQISGRFVF